MLLHTLQRTRQIPPQRTIQVQMSVVPRLINPYLKLLGEGELRTRGSQVKNPPADAGAAGDLGSIPGWGRSKGEGNSNPVQY